MNQPNIPNGSKLGIHTLQTGGPVLSISAECKRRGFRMPLIKAVDNGGIAIDAKKLDPSILTITRKVNIDEDSAQFISDGFVDIPNLRRHAQAAVDFPIKGRGSIRPLSPEEIAAADWLEILNEADPPGAIGWKNFGLYLCEVIDYATQVRVPIAIPGTNLGTPEWDEMQALVSTGLFKKMKDSWSNPNLKHGHIWTAHEGVLPGSNEQLVFGSIPGSPLVPGAGPTAWRYRFLYKLLADRNEIVPLVISEYYGTGGYSPGNADAIIAGLSKYDQEIRKDNYVLAALPFTMAGTPGNWDDQDYTPIYPKLIDYMQSIKDFANGTASTPIPPPTPPPTTTKFLVGVHGRAEGRLAQADLTAITRSKVEAVKLMSTADPNDVDSLRAIKPDMFIMVRLFESFKDRNITPADFVSHQIDIMSAFYKKGIRYFEVHNEPNLYAEGFGSSWNNGSEFGKWYSEVCRVLHLLLPDTQLGFPGLSPGQDVTWEDQGKSGYIRYDQQRFINEARPYINMANWVGVHCYFVNNMDRSSIPEWGGRNYEIFLRMFPGKKLYITEFSRPTDESADVKGADYVEYYKQVHNVSNVGAAFCFILSGHDWAKEAWRLENGNLTTIPDRIGAYMNTPVATGMTHSVTAAVLNVRQFPWLSIAEPPLTGQLKAGNLVRSYGTVILPGMLFGWHLISPNGNQWVSGKYLKPAV